MIFSRANKIISLSKLARFGLMVLALAGMAAQVRADEPVPLLAHYAMEPDAKDARKFTDSGPLHIDGRINDGVEYVPNGHKGYALRFSGSGEDTARVDNPKLINRAGAPISVTMWIKPEAWASREAFAALLTKTTEAWIGRPFAFTLGGPGELGFESASGGSGYTASLLELGKWQHVAVTYQAGGKRILYINEKEVSRTDAGPDLQDNEEPLIFGAEKGYYGSDGGRSKYKGLMDEEAIYAAALTPEQIRLDMNGELKTRAATLADFSPRKQTRAFDSGSRRYAGGLSAAQRTHPADRAAPV